MNEFLHTIRAGIFPFYFLFAVIGIIGRIRRRQWTGFDTLVILTFLVFELLAAFQVCLFYGLLTTSRRYLFIGIPLYLPYTALGFRDIWRILSKFKFGKPAAAVFAVGICATFFYVLYFPIFTELSHNSKKGMERSFHFVAAEWIRSDWNRLPAANEAPLQVMKCDQYQSGKRPLVETYTEWPRLGCFAGGQNYPEFLRGSDILPDYIVLPAEFFAENDQNGDIPVIFDYRVSEQDEAVSRQYRQVHADTVDGITFAVFRNAALLPGD